MGECACTQVHCIEGEIQNNFLPRSGKCTTVVLQTTVDGSRCPIGHRTTRNAFLYSLQTILSSFYNNRYESSSHLLEQFVFWHLYYIFSLLEFTIEDPIGVSKREAINSKFVRIAECTSLVS